MDFENLKRKAGAGQAAIMLSSTGKLTVANIQGLPFDELARVLIDLDWGWKNRIANVLVGHRRELRRQVVARITDESFPIDDLVDEYTDLLGAANRSDGSPYYETRRFKGHSVIPILAKKIKATEAPAIDLIHQANRLKDYGMGTKFGLSKHMLRRAKSLI